MTSNINFVPGRIKGSRNVIHEGHRYCLDKKRDDKTYWRCSLKTCSGRLNLLADTTVTGTKPHTHPPTPAETHLLLDGTFKTAPNLFTQLVTIHGLFDDGWRMPLAYGLLPGKTQHHYEALLAEIASFRVEPQSVMSDYERALMNAVEKTWPTTTRRGCFFHHKQALWKKMQHHDLVPEYNVENSPVRKAFQMIGAIAFVDLGDVQDTWALLKPTVPPEMEFFAHYYERTWVGTATSSPLYSPWIWNQRDAVMAGLPRSSNIAEGY